MDNSVATATYCPLHKDLKSLADERQARRPAPGKTTTTRHRAKRTARPGRIGHGSATNQMVNPCGELACASLPRPKHGVVAPNLGDDSGRHEDLWNHRATPSFGWELPPRDNGEKNTEKPVGLLINFNVRQLTEGIKRFRIGMQRFPLNLSCERKTICNMLFGNWLWQQIRS